MKKNKKKNERKNNNIKNEKSKETTKKNEPVIKEEQTDTPAAAEAAPAKIPALFEKIGLRVVCFLSIALGFWLSAVSLITTVAVDNITEGKGVSSSLYYIRQTNESVIYYNDNFFMNVFLLLLSVLAVYFLSTKLSSIRLRYKLLFLFLWTSALGTIWVLSSQSAPNTDSGYIVNNAVAFSVGNYNFLNEGTYFKWYPFQLGYVLFCQIIVKIVNIFFEPKTNIYLEVFNAFFLGAVNVLVVMITQLTTKNKKASTAVTILLALSCAPILSCSFIYGIIPGLFFALIALYAELRWLMDDKKLFGVISVICIAMAVMIKSNYLIWLIAMVLIAVVMMFKKKKYVWNCIFMAAAVILSLSVQPAVKAMYESKSGADLGDGIPYSAWIAMGLNEASSAPGWFNFNFTTGKYDRLEGDLEKIAEESKETIAERVKFFMRAPQYTNDFFYKKAVSQWNETSYESIWTNIIRNQYKEKNAFAKWVCDKGSKKVRKYMDLWAQLMFFSFTAGIAVIMKKKNFPAASFAVIFLGGFFFQMLSEGKSQYILPYIIIMTGIAGYGLVICGEQITAFIKKKREEKKAKA